ncbi:MAG: hypothetical protein ACK4NX_02040, partial [Candidatus Paceibacteria bacterium]
HYFLVNYLSCDGGIMVTASHNPPQYNGLKFVKQQAKPIFLGDGLDEIYKLMDRAPKTFKKYPGPKKENFIPAYVEFFKIRFERFFKKDAKPLKIAIDNGNGVASLVLEELIKEFSWIQPIKLFWEQDPDFSGRGPNPSHKGALSFLCAAVLKHRADFGIAFDGDADRILFIDENGKQILPDFITAYLGENMLKEAPGSLVIIPVGTSRIVEEKIKEAGGKVIFSRMGNVFVSSKIEEYNAIFGGERSGHYYFRDFFFRDGAIFTLLSVIRFWLGERRPFSEIFSNYAKYVTSGELNIAVENQQGAISGLKDAFKNRARATNEIDGFWADLGDVWFLLRQSQTEPILRLIVEGKNSQAVNKTLNEIQKILSGMHLDNMPDSV